MKKLLKNSGVQSFIASLICIVIGMFVGFLFLLAIEPSGAGEAILAVAKNFFAYSRRATQLKYLGSTLVKTAPLLMCSLSVLFSYKVGLFNIGAAGQYVMGACACLYAAIMLGWGWLPCMILAAVAGGVYGAITGLLKAYANVNEVISGIMLNWIGLYFTNMVLSQAKDASSAYTYPLQNKGPKAILPSLGLTSVFGDNKYVGIAIPLAVIFAILVWVLLEKTKLGYELKATGFNKNAAKYCGMAEKRNVILSLVISGVLAGLAGSFMYQTDMEQWQVTIASVPGMGFNGIAAAFLGGLNPIGAIFSSFFIQHITDGGSNVDLSIYCSQISDLISSLIIYLCGFVAFIKYAMNTGIAKSEEKKAAKAVAEKGGDK
ncbi:MAG: ABC transporter permease [Agathobacter sp.]|nr:ABC transporter permease [Agathobacter sp.]